MRKIFAKRDSFGGTEVFVGLTYSLSDVHDGIRKDENRKFYLVTCS